MSVLLFHYRTEIICEIRKEQAALRTTGQRGVIATGNGALTDGAFGDDMFVLDQAPHDWLFSRMAAVVNHGGAGTAGAAFRAGVPQVVCPFFGGQLFWEQRVAALGVGPQPNPRKRITAETLTAAILDVVNQVEMRKCAARLGEAIRNEQGVEQAVLVVTDRASMRL